MSSEPVAADDAVALAAEFLRHPEAVAQLGGERDANVLVRDDDGARYVLKVGPADPPGVSGEAEAFAAFEVDALERLARTDPGIPVPRVVRAGGSRSNPGSGRAVIDAGGGRRARMVTYLPGDPLPPRPGPALLSGLGDVVARVDLALAGWAQPVPRRELLWDLRIAPTIRPLLAHLADPEPARHALDVYQGIAAPLLDVLPQQVIHNDANPSNVLTRAGGVSALIDFGDMVRAAAVQDLATACAYQVHDDSEPLRDVATIVAAYHARRPLSDAEFTILPALIGARSVLIVAVSAANARAAPANEAYLMRNNARGAESLRALRRLAPDAAAEYLRNAARAGRPGASGESDTPREMTR